MIELDDPWGSSFLNDDELIITEKGGKIKIFDIKLKKIFDCWINLF